MSFGLCRRERHDSWQVDTATAMATKFTKSAKITKDGKSGKGDKGDSKGTKTATAFRASGIRICFVIRISSFDIPHFDKECGLAFDLRAWLVDYHGLWVTGRVAGPGAGMRIMTDGR